MPEKKGPDAITAISVKGFKSFAEETRLEIRPLTLLAGANSSGKSSAMQPILMLKQTLEASYDPGSLLLHDAHVKFTAANQLLHHRPGERPMTKFEVGLELRTGVGFISSFRRGANKKFDLVQEHFFGPSDTLVPWIEEAGKVAHIYLRLGMPGEELAKVLPKSLVPGYDWEVWRDRCFLQVGLRSRNDTMADDHYFLYQMMPTAVFDRVLRRIIHVPGLRGNPTRAYRTTAVGEFFIGTFENYVASMIVAWQESEDERLSYLGRALGDLGLSWKVRAKLVDATQVELLVGRLPIRRQGGASDLVNVADVGFGVSQTLPVLVALLVAEPAQLVYLEQPELHLHPRAQEALARILVDAANRGVQVVAETHSSILLLAVQALVAEGKIDPDKVKLHWFQRGDDGVTKVTSADLDPQGAYGDWPEDFGEVRARAENRYLDAVEAKAFPPKKRKRNAKGR